MRIKTLKIAWFRGAADSVAVDAGGKSMAIYGSNASGKSSFTDAVEYLLTGRVNHLAHEYSGKHQERALLNTHRKSTDKTRIELQLADDTVVSAEIDAAGACIREGNSDALSAWDHRKTVLRQDEVAHFISQTKGEKYSALLPLLGLEPLESTAENLRQLAKAVAREARVGTTAGALKAVEQKRSQHFGSADDAALLARLAALCAKYGVSTEPTDAATNQCAAVKQAVKLSAEENSTEQRRQAALQRFSRAKVKEQINAVRNASSKLASSAEPLIRQRLDVLQTAGAFASQLVATETVHCPACGTEVAVVTFQSHVAEEKKRLQDSLSNLESHRGTVANLSDTIKGLQTLARADELSAWAGELIAHGLSDNLDALRSLNAEGLRAKCIEEDLAAIEAAILPLLEQATIDAASAPPTASEIVDDETTVAILSEVFDTAEQRNRLNRALTLAKCLELLEESVRRELRQQAGEIVSAISTQIQAMWAVLHPGETIEDVKLYLPAQADKAVDVGLKFYKKPLDSPRLTLSEGNRNCLGLCIFLAMAEKAGGERPLFLDDVVVSLDRQHRGMLAELLESRFGNRQVLLLTHDRDWFSELRQQLDVKRWQFRVLLPFDSPELGIRWSHRVTEFDDARAQLATRPDSAGNDARKIMDVQLAIAAEKLGLRLPFARGDRNDHRGAHEFLERMIADGKKSFQCRSEANYVPHATALNALEQADKLLVTWGNKSSHSFDVVRAEAEKVIDACEHAMAVFRCDNCTKDVWRAEVADKQLQCECGMLRWVLK